MHVLLVGGSVRFGLTCPALAWDLSSKALSAPFFIKWPPPSSFLSLAFKGAVAAILITLSETSVGVPFALESSVPVGGLAGGGGGGEGDGIGEGGGGEGEGEIGGNGGDESGGLGGGGEGGCGGADGGVDGGGGAGGGDEGGGGGGDGGRLGGGDDGGGGGGRGGVDGGDGGAGGGGDPGERMRIPLLSELAEAGVMRRARVRVRSTDGVGMCLFGGMFCGRRRGPSIGMCGLGSSEVMRLLQVGSLIGRMIGFWLFGALERLVAFGAAPLDGTRGRPTSGVEVGPLGCSTRRLSTSEGGSVNSQYFEFGMFGSRI